MTPETPMRKTVGCRIGWHCWHDQHRQRDEKHKSGYVMRITFTEGWCCRCGKHRQWTNNVEGVIA